MPSLWVGYQFTFTTVKDNSREYDQLQVNEAVDHSHLMSQDWHVDILIVFSTYSTALAGHRIASSSKSVLQAIFMYVVGMGGTRPTK